MGARTEWSPAEWNRAIADLPEDDRWAFIQIERATTGDGPPMSRTRLKALHREMQSEARSLLSAWLSEERRCRTLEVAQ